MIASRVADCFLAPNDESAVIDKFVDGLPLTLGDKFVLMVIFSGARLIAFLDDDDRDKAMDIHDSLAECLLDLQLFGTKPTAGPTSVPVAIDSKRDNALFRIRKSNIAVGKASGLPKLEAFSTKTMSSSQVTRPGTGESSSSSLRLQPIAMPLVMQPSMVKPQSEVKLRATDTRPFAVPFAAQQDLIKKTGGERFLVLTSLTKRFVAGVLGVVSQPFRTALNEGNIKSLAADLQTTINNVLHDYQSSEIQKIVKESSGFKISECSALANLVDQLKSVDTSHCNQMVEILQPDLVAVTESKDVKTLRFSFKSLHDKIHDVSHKTRIIEIAAITCSFTKFMSVARSSKSFTLMNIMQDLETRRKVCGWFAKCIASWGKIVADFKDQECSQDKLFSDLGPLVAENLASMKHLFSFLKFTSTLEKLPPKAIPTLEYYLPENRDAWRALMSKN